MKRMAKKEYTEAELKAMLKSAKKRKKESGAFRNRIIIFIFVTNLIVLAASLYITKTTGVEPAVTVTVWFGWTTVELALVAGLTANERKQETRRLENQNRIEKEGEI